LIAFVAIAVPASLWSGLATGAEFEWESPTGPTATVYIKGGEGGPRFVAPRTVTVGEKLRVVEQANPRRVGPDTFSLVSASLIPTTPRARQLCFTKGQICRAIGAWHGVAGDGPPTVNPVEAGAEGWDTPPPEPRSTSSARSIRGCRARSSSCPRAVDVRSGPGRLRREPVMMGR